MSVFHGKLLELKSIENKSGEYFLHAKLSSELDIEMLWKIDEYTAENLKEVTQFDGKHRYRLSFHSSWDVIQQRHKGILTRTYREQSEPISFSCSEDYINKLTSIKHCHHINDLDKLTFISHGLAPIDEQLKEEGQKQNKNEEEILQKNIRKFTQTSIAVISAIFVILFSYLSCFSPNKTSFDQKALAQSTQSDDDVIAEQVIAKQKESLSPEKNIIVENVSSNRHTIPFIELDKAITYSIPEGNVALTFDDGPSPYSKEIADLLMKYRVGGTFFFAWYNVERYPDCVEYIQSNGFSIGSHSMSHADMPTLSYEKQESELVQSISLLEEITNEEIILFRPPYGSFNKHIKDLINEHKYKMVLWNNDPKDWKTRDADKIFNHIQNSHVSGSIIILHESQAVIDALPRIIEYLQEQDLQIINLK